MEHMYVELFCTSSITPAGLKYLLIMFIRQIKLHNLGHTVNCSADKLVYNSTFKVLSLLTVQLRHMDSL